MKSDRENRGEKKGGGGGGGGVYSVAKCQQQKEQGIN